MKTVWLEFGKGRLKLKVPDSTDVLSSAKVEAIQDISSMIVRSLNQPLASKPLSELARGCKDAAIVISDNTRPVPYKGPQGILRPLINTLHTSRVDKIKIIVATGTHRPMTQTELRQMLDESAFGKGIEIINHIATDDSMLRSIGSTQRTPVVTVSKHYLDAELKILTGLVEPHFMAGFSGGRKAICPGICGQSVTYGFHSARILDDENSANLVLEGNPCHEEALRIAKMAGADFTVNVTINNDGQITGVFSGDLQTAHTQAVRKLLSYVTIPLTGLYDVVITHGGIVGLNHYQCAKAAMEAARPAKPDAAVILASDLTDHEPIGSRNYKDVLKLLAQLGPQDFRKKILDEAWQFIPEQWEVQMWAKALERLDSPKQLYICAPKLENCPAGQIPETNVAKQNKRRPGENDIDYARRMVQDMIDKLLGRDASKKLLILPDGPYAIPVITKRPCYED